MGEIAKIAPLLAGVVQLVGAGVGAISSAAQGRAAQKQADFQAAQLEQRAGQERAQAQRVAEDKRREASILASNLRAAAGASGGGVTDPTVSKLEADIAGQGEYNALAALFNGEEQALSNETQAAAARVSGKTARKAGYLGAASDLLSGAANSATMFMKYGGK